MNEDTVAGTAKKAGGSIESAFGNATGNKSLEAKGEARKLAGSAQNFLGKAEDKILNIAEGFCGAVNNASDDISQVTARVKSEIHESPVRSSFIALGVGFIIGTLLAR